MPSLACKSYICDPRPHYPLLITAKRYWHPDQDPSEDLDSLTLILAHGTGYHKEQWEPTIEDLYEILRSRGTGAPKVREVWSIDCPNHGEAAVLNEKVLQWGYWDYFDWQEYARCIHIFLTGLGSGVDANFTGRKLVGIGHSMGACALTLAGTFAPELVFHALVLVEPMLYPETTQHTSGSGIGGLIEGALKRRDIWPSREEALSILRSRPAFQQWDPRVLKIFVEDGLRPLPTADYPDRTDGVTLKCSRKLEAACYRNVLGRVRSYNNLPHLCSNLPVHFIYGAISDYLSPEIKSDVVTAAAKGKHASYQEVPGAGHLVLQVRPRGLAIAIATALKPHTAALNASHSRL
ncbi:alpha/beta-hydrolase [Obba rivulosa]|uniref:Alpha/beta-hydrolase n=1 Tax=Obba rivulosa TaxID=1052685 RepID=A0A8E2APT8_9APHY|nr:alpha/beta-hydrolase [Obba rivulosa]